MMCWRKRISVAPDRIVKFVCSSCGSFPPYGGFARITLYLFFSETLAVWSSSVFACSRFALSIPWSSMFMMPSK